MGWEWSVPAAKVPRYHQSKPEPPSSCQSQPHSHPEPQQMPHFPEHIPTSALELIAGTMRLNGSGFGKFVSAWMQLPRCSRKSWSYSGAVKSEESDPKHYICPFTAQCYFDPGNFTYAMTLAIMSPDLMALENWNWETTGDICESMMGANYEWSVVMSRPGKELVGCRFLFGRTLKLCSDLIEHFVWHTYQLLVQVGQEQMLSWVRCIVDIVHRRKNIGEDHSASEVAVGHPHELVVFAPRDKSDGFLNRAP